MIEAGKFRSTYVVPRTHAWPHSVRERLDGIALSELPRAVARAMERFAAGQDDSSIWMFRHIAFHANLDLERDNGALAADWAAQFVSELTRRLDDDPQQEEVVRFSNEADLLRSFVIDAAASRTDKWYYSRFDGLKALSTTAQIRTVLCTAGLNGLDALVGMTTRQLQQMIAAISENDAGKIWITLAAQVPEAAVVESLPELRRTWQTEGGFAPDGGGEMRWALHMAVAALRGQKSDARSWLVAARPIGRLMRVLRTMAQADCGFVIDSLATARHENLHRVLNGVDVQALEPLLGCPRTVLAEFLEQRPAAEDFPERRYTPFGGVFFLLPFLDALPIPSAIRSPSLFRFWILLKCLGNANAVRLFEDPLIREVIQIDPELSAESFCEWQRAIGMRALRLTRRSHQASDLIRDNSGHATPSDFRYLCLPRLLSGGARRDRWLNTSALLVMRSLAWRLPGFSTASLPHLFVNFLDFPASVEEYSDRRVVRLGTPPLQVLLNMTGICRWRYPLSWRDEKRFELYPEAP